MRLTKEQKARLISEDAGYRHHHGTWYAPSTTLVHEKIDQLPDWFGDLNAIQHLVIQIPGWNDKWIPTSIEWAPPPAKEYYHMLHHVTVGRAGTIRNRSGAPTIATAEERAEAYGLWRGLWEDGQ